MRNRLIMQSQQSPSLHSPGSSVIQDTLRGLVRQVLDTVDPTVMLNENEETDSVLVDLEIDGARYILVRSPVRSGRREVTLSPREQEIARMVADGHANKTIAAVLDISLWTVGTHLRRIFAKLGVSSRSAMVAELFDQGLVRPVSRDRGIAPETESQRRPSPRTLERQFQDMAESQR